MYTVLARKYRPQTFDDVIGQEPIARTLENAIKTDRVAHAFLFTGTRGIGKTTMARLLAKSLNCLNAKGPTTKPCCKCNSCQAVNAGEDVDVIEIDGASNRGIENIRELRQNAIYRTARSRFKIYIIDEVHMLTTESFNALLKVLEEPPAHVKFIFATTEPNKVIATIQSRCQRFDFHNITPADIADQLKKILEQEKIKYEDDLLLPLAKMANGSMRDALSLLDRLISTGEESLNSKLLEEFLGCPDSQKVYNLVTEIGDSKPSGTLKAIDNLISTGLSEAQIVEALIDCMRDLMVLKSAGPETGLLILTNQQRKQTQQLAKKFDTAALVYNITTLEKLRWSVRNSDTARALLEASLLRLTLSEHFININELLNQAGKNISRPSKKKESIRTDKTSTIPADLSKPKTTAQSELNKLNDLQSIKKNWQTILAEIGAKLGPGTEGLLRAASPTQFENSILTITFPASAEMSKKICEGNGRVQAIEDVLAEQFSTAVKVKFDNRNLESPPTDEPVPLSTPKRTELLNNSVVKTVLSELGATVINIEQQHQ